MVQFSVTASFSASSIYILPYNVNYVFMLCLQRRDVLSIVVIVHSANIHLYHQRNSLLIVSSPDPTYERGSGGIRLIPQASLTLITFWREISLRQSHCRKHNLQCNTGNSWLLQHDDTALFLACKLVISSQLCIQKAMNF